MKDIGRLLQKGNLTPKERVRLLANNAISKERKGKPILTEADEHAIGEAWTPQNNKEATEFNKYSKAWRTYGMAELDAQTCYLRARVCFQGLKTILFDCIRYPHISEIREALEHLKKISIVKEKEAGEVFKSRKDEKLQAGFNLALAIHKLTLELLDEESRKSLLELDPSIEAKADWIEQEISISKLKYTTGADFWTCEGKDLETLAEMVSKAGRLENGEYDINETYACFALWEIARHYADKQRLECAYTAGKKILSDHPDEEGQGKDNAPQEHIKRMLAVHSLGKLPELNEAIKTHAEKIGKTVEAIIKDTLKEWIQEETASEDDNINASPLVVDEPELLKKWVETNQKARDIINALINKGTLKTSTDGKTITGESLYNCQEGYKVIQDFKAYADEYTARLKAEDGAGEDIYQGRELVISNKEQFYPFQFHRIVENIENAVKSLTTIEEKTVNGKKVINIRTGKDADDNDEQRFRPNFNAQFINEREGFIKDYGSLLSFFAVNKRLSDVFDIDLNYNVSSYLAQLVKDASLLNSALMIALDGQEDKTLEDDKLLINPEDIKPLDEITKYYVKELSDTLGDEFDE